MFGTITFSIEDDLFPVWHLVDKIVQGSQPPDRVSKGFLTRNYTMGKVTSNEEVKFHVYILSYW